MSSRLDEAPGFNGTNARGFHLESGKIEKLVLLIDVVCVWTAGVPMTLNVNGQVYNKQLNP